MPFFSEIFFSSLIGKPVYALDESYIGEFRDFVVRRRNDNFVITKIRIRKRSGDRIVLPWNDVYSIDTVPISFRLKKMDDAITLSEYDEDEFRLKRDMLDQQIIDMHHHRVVRVNDIRIVSIANELVVVAADIGFRGLMRRIGIESFAMSISRVFGYQLQNKLIPSKYIDPYPARLRHDIQLTVGQEDLKNMHPADIADIVEHLDMFERLSMIKALPPQVMADSIFELEPEVRKALVKQLKDEELSFLLRKMSPDEATDVVAELPHRRMHKVLDFMKGSHGEDVKELLKFKDGTAGSMMNTEFITFPGDMSARAALSNLRKNHKFAEQIYYLYIVGPDESLVGVVSLRELIFVEPKTQLAELVNYQPHYVLLDETVDSVIEKFTKYNLIAMPVLDEEKKIQGIITVDDVLSELDESTE